MKVLSFLSLKKNMFVEMNIREIKIIQNERKMYKIV